MWGCGVVGLPRIPSLMHVVIRGDKPVVSLCPRFFVVRCFMPSNGRGIKVASNIRCRKQDVVWLKSLGLIKIVAVDRILTVKPG